jgi:hypothetical protein
VKSCMVFGEVCWRSLMIQPSILNNVKPSGYLLLLRFLPEIRYSSSKLSANRPLMPLRRSNCPDLYKSIGKVGDFGG